MPVLEPKPGMRVIDPLDLTSGTVLDVREEDSYFPRRLQVLWDVGPEQSVPVEEWHYLRVVR